MERLDLGHLHPKLEIDMSRPEIEPGPLASEHSSKELFEQRVNSYSEHLHISSRHDLK
jgi:hypothetical protein